MPIISKEKIRGLLIASTPAARGFRVCTKALKEQGFGIVTAETGREFIDRLRRRPFVCAVIQEQLSDIDCWRLAKIIRSGRFCSPTLPLVVLCQAERTPGLEAIANRLNAFLAFPSEDDNLEKVIASAISEQKRSSVLIIEDDPDAAETARRTLDSEYIVDVEYDGTAGLSAWKQKRHDLVLLDLMLPELTGEEVLKSIMSIDAKQPVIIVTAFPSHQRHSNLMLLGASEFVEKPFDINMLRALCRGVLHEAALCEADVRLNKANTTIQKAAAKASAASLNLKQGRAGTAALHLDGLLGEAMRELTDDEWVEVLNEVDTE